MGHPRAVVHLSLLCKADFYSHSPEEDVCSEDTIPVTEVHIWHPFLVPLYGPFSITGIMGMLQAQTKFLCVVGGGVR